MDVTLSLSLSHTHTHTHTIHKCDVPWPHIYNVPRAHEDEYPSSDGHFVLTSISCASLPLHEGCKSHSTNKTIIGTRFRISCKVGGEVVWNLKDFCWTASSHGPRIGPNDFGLRYVEHRTTQPEIWETYLTWFQECTNKNNGRLKALNFSPWYGI